MAHDPLQEASDPTTTPERLEELADHEDLAVMRATWRNPSLPEDVWRTALLRGELETWDNPMAPFYVMTWTPREDDTDPLETGSRMAAVDLLCEPECCSAEGKALLNAKVQEWWAITVNTYDMILLLQGWAEAKGDGSPEHKEVLRILLLCLRTDPAITDEDRQVFDLLEAWIAGSKDRRNEAETLADSTVADDTCLFARNTLHSPWNPIYELLNYIELTEGEEAEAAHDRLMADVIRRAMPLPPVVD
jgi:hypothetical protein